MLTSDGKEANPRDRRMMRAVDQKTAYGAQLQHTSWLMYEFSTMRDLFQLGAAVPEPIVASENAILMEYIGDENLAAPTLNSVHLEPDEAQILYKEVIRNIELMLSQHIVHGDLSAYNILYWEHKITLIDFPQVVDVRANDNGYMILHRDLTRVCDYFAKQGVECDAQMLTDELWAQYIGSDERGREADASRFQPEEDDD